LPDCEWASRAAHAAEAGLRWREQQDDGGFYDNCKLPGEVTTSTTSNDELLRPSAQVHQARIRKRKRDTKKVGTLRRDLRKQSILPDFFPAPDDNQDNCDDHRNDNHHDDDMWRQQQQQQLQPQQERGQAPVKDRDKILWGPYFVHVCQLPHYLTKPASTSVIVVHCMLQCRTLLIGFA
jgi:hypothetical protein